MENKHVFICEETIGQLNFITLTGKVEITTTQKGNFLVKELIYFSMTEKFDTSNTVTMYFKTSDLLNLMYALDEVYRTGNSDFKKFTDSSKSNNTNTNNTKFVNVRVDDKGKFYINLNIVDNNKPKEFKKVSFERYEIRAAIKTIDMFCKEYKENLYKAQRHYTKLNDENKNK